MRTALSYRRFSSTIGSTGGRGVHVLSCTVLETIPIIIAFELHQSTDLVFQGRSKKAQPKKVQVTARRERESQPEPDFWSLYDRAGTVAHRGDRYSTLGIAVLAVCIGAYSASHAQCDAHEADIQIQPLLL